MSDISAEQVRELRSKTGLGLMDCKKALQESSGNIDLAIVNLRKSSALKAEKKSSRTALEGIILASSFESIKWIVMVEVNCETDFVAKDKNFLNFCNKVLESAQELHNSDEPLKRISEEVEEKTSVRRLSLFDNIEEKTPVDTSKQPINNDKAEPVHENSLQNEANILESETEKNEFEPEEADSEEDLNQDAEEELLDIPTFLRRQAN